MFDMKFHIATILIVLAVYIWHSFSKAREIATKQCILVCSKLDVQLLDQSITIKYITIKRNQFGQLQLLRGYRFEFSINGYDRNEGFISLFGRNIENIQLDHPDGKIIMDDSSIHSVN